MEEKIITDGSGRQISISQDDFKLIQHDKKIYDVKFKNKATTFLKDALKRFAKSKPALIGFIIVGVLFVMSLIVPISSENIGAFNVAQEGGGDQQVERGLSPKLFDAGTGFWDGTVKREHVLFNTTTNTPSGYREGTYFNLRTYEEVVNDVSSVYGHGGSVNVRNLSNSAPGYFYSPEINFDFTNSQYNLSFNLTDANEDGYVFNGYKLYLHNEENTSNDFSFNLTNFEASGGNLEEMFGTWTGTDYNGEPITIVIESPDLENEGRGSYNDFEFTYTFDPENPNSINVVIAEFESLTFSFTYNEENENPVSLRVSGSEIAVGNNYYLAGDENIYSKETTVNLNINEMVDEYNLTTLNAELRFELPASDENGYSNIFISNLSITSDNDIENETLNEISFSDGNSLLIRGNNSGNSWKNSSAVSKSGYQITIPYCDFTFDQYENAYGIRTYNYGAIELRPFIESGALIVDFSNGTEATSDLDVLSQRFKVVDSDECPIIRVVSQDLDATRNPVSGEYTGYGITCEVHYYRILGYDEMPRFIFGTNDSAKDYFKLIFTGLRFSLLFAIGVSLVNICFGLVWGSISGYYGGWIDIGMERICDIIGGLPTTVLITLVIMYGNQFNWGDSSDVIALMISIFLTGWMGVARQTRTQFYRFKNREYVLASRTLGAKDRRLIFRHILPNSAGTIITSSVLIIPSVMYTEASIAYLGLGLSNQVMFGVILSDAKNYYMGDKTFLLIIPTVIMVLLLVSFNLFGNGLRDAFNPSLKGSKN